MQGEAEQATCSGLLNAQEHAQEVSEPETVRVPMGNAVTFWALILDFP